MTEKSDDERTAGAQSITEELAALAPENFAANLAEFHPDAIDGLRQVGHGVYALLEKIKQSTEALESGKQDNADLSEEVRILRNSLEHEERRASLCEKVSKESLEALREAQQQVSALMAERDNAREKEYHASHLATQVGDSLRTLQAEVPALCSVCGKRGIYPNKPCFVCEVERLRGEIRRRDSRTRMQAIRDALLSPRAKDGNLLTHQQQD